MLASFTEQKIQVPRVPKRKDLGWYSTRADVPVATARTVCVCAVSLAAHTRLVTLLSPTFFSVPIALGRGQGMQQRVQQS